MRLTQRLLLQSTVVTVLFGVAILGTVEWRVRHRLELQETTTVVGASPQTSTAAEAASAALAPGISAMRSSVAGFVTATGTSSPRTNDPPM